MFRDKKDKDDLFGFFDTINSLFDVNFPFARLDFDKDDDECEDSLHTIKYSKGVSTYDAFENGKRVKHEVKKLKDGKWVPVEGNCCLTKEDSKDCPIGTNDVEIKPLGPCMIKKSEQDSSVKDEITRLREANRKLRDENANLRRELKDAASEMSRFKDLMEDISESFKQFNKKNK